MLFSKMPFNGKDYDDFDQDISSLKFFKFVLKNKKLSNDLKDFITSGMHIDKTQRLHSHQILELNWFKTSIPTNQIKLLSQDSV